MKKLSSRTSRKKQNYTFYNIVAGAVGLGCLTSLFIVQNRQNTPSVTPPSPPISTDVATAQKPHHKPVDFTKAQLFAQAEILSIESSHGMISPSVASEHSLVSQQTRQDVSPKDTSPQEHFSYYCTLGGNYTHVDFDPHGSSSFQGNLGGAQGSFAYQPLHSFYEGLFVSWKQGHMHGSAGNRSLLYVDVQERFGYTAGCNLVSCTFFTGLGYRHMGQKHNPNHGGSVKFRYNDLYLPVGALAVYAPSSWFSIGINGCWMPQVYPTVSIAPLQGARWILTRTLSSFSVELPINFTVTKNENFHIVLNPFYERWKDGHSTAKTSTGVALGLPGNTYNFWGGQLNFLYSF